jgi:acetyl esterase/lipase
MSRATGLRVISVDYTTIPFAKWKEIQEQVISVFKALLADGYEMKDIALYGESAGGGLAISTALNLRDRGMGMPAALVLWSPWADLSNAGDTAHTLENADPALTYASSLENGALAFADGLDLTDPHVSPLYADFSKGFPPSLITEGTKCIFLSTSVRLYQALEAAGQETKLDVYEGMWHVFQQVPIPESEVAIRKSAAFINKHLK